MLINYVHVKIILHKIRIIRQILLTRTHTSMYQYFVDIVNKHPLPPPPNSFNFVCLQIKKDICFRIVSMQSMETHKCKYGHVFPRQF